ncbi:MAG: hypothetical protein Q4F05_00400 [bacterium]|nr:hypothetical protein [bacterium]
MIYISLGIYLVFLVGFLLTRNYEKKFTKSLNKKEHSLHLFYPMALYVAHFFDRPKTERYKNRLDQMKVLHVNEDPMTQYKIFRAKQVSLVIVCILAFNALAICLTLTSEKESIIKDGTITRPAYGEESSEVEVDVVFDNSEESIKQHTTISVAPRAYTREEFDQAAEKANNYLEKVILGKNASLDKIYYPLHLVNSIPDTGISVDWELDKEKLIAYDGTVNHKGLTESKFITITAVMKSGEFELQHMISMTILPEQLSKEDKLLYNFESSLDSANEESITNDKITLPTSIDNHNVYYQEKEDNSYGTFLVFAALVLVLIYLMMEQQLNKQKEERNIEIMLDYPEVVNKFTLLIGAGMTIKKAWERIVFEYEEQKDSNKTKRRYAYEELKVTLFELNNGLNEAKAYENFGRRMQVLPYMKFSSLLSQNSSKGMDGILAALELESYSAFEERKELAKRLGEKAGTKLLLPMGIMLLLVFIMILIPAFINF